jgi:hypothetical protein
MSFKFDDTMKIEIPEAVAAFIPGAAFIDPDGLTEDLKRLTENEWQIGVVQAGSVGASKDSVTIVATQAKNKFRLSWALSIHSKDNVKLGYAEAELRPGDLEDETVYRLVTAALEAGEEEVKKWSDALALARAAVA